ncbi:MAG TPA: PD-(D/E)XK nuclease family protein [Solirubrobacteraceae bacterium]|nr:PD-(D/E)XK nuclease family protein [Solirubrobacteraceae bacterium]
MVEAPVRGGWSAARAASRSTFVFPNTTAEYPGHLSPSQVTSFLRCAECYRLARIEKIPRPLSIHLPIGSAVHKAIEHARLRNLDGTVDAHSSDEIAAEWFDQEVAAPADPEDGAPLAEVDLKSYDSLGKAKDVAVALARFAVPKILALDRQRGKIAAVEYNLLALSSPYPFRMEGRLDALYCDWLAEGKPEDATIMADTKTSAKQEPPDEYTAIAQTIYEEFWSSRGKPLVVLADVIDKRVHPEVKTYPLMVDEYARALTHRTVMGVAEDIAAGRFRPTPNWSCDYVHGFAEFQLAVQGFAA